MTSETPNSAQARKALVEDLLKEVKRSIPDAQKFKRGVRQGLKVVAGVNGVYIAAFSKTGAQVRLSDAQLAVLQRSLGPNLITRAFGSTLGGSETERWVNMMRSRVEQIRNDPDKYGYLESLDVKDIPAQSNEINPDNSSKLANMWTYVRLGPKPPRRYIISHEFRFEIASVVAGDQLEVIIPDQFQLSYEVSSSELDALKAGGLYKEFATTMDQQGQSVPVKDVRIVSSDINTPLSARQELDAHGESDIGHMQKTAKGTAVAYDHIKQQFNLAETDALNVRVIDQNLASAEISLVIDEDRLDDAINSVDSDKSLSDALNPAKLIRRGSHPRTGENFSHFVVDVTLVKHPDSDDFVPLAEAIESGDIDRIPKTPELVRQIDMYRSGESPVRAAGRNARAVLPVLEGLELQLRKALQVIINQGLKAKS